MDPNHGITEITSDSELGLSELTLSVLSAVDIFVPLKHSARYDKWVNHSEKMKLIRELKDG